MFVFFWNILLFGNLCWQQTTIDMFRLSKIASLKIDAKIYWKSKEITLFWGGRYNIPTRNSSHVDAAVNPHNVHGHWLQGAVVRDAF